jgi:choline kinase/phosphohistidine swiveling domain-containing protein
MAKVPINVILLGAGRPAQGRCHAALNKTLEGSRILDWLLNTLPGRAKQVQFVGGYEIKQIAARYPQLDVCENKNWKNTGASGSLFSAQLPANGDLLVSYTDIIYHSEAVKEVLASNADITVAIDSDWVERFQGRSDDDLRSSEKVAFVDRTVTRLGADIGLNTANAEFIGLVKFSKSALQLLLQLSQNEISNLASTNLSALVERLRISGLKVEAVDLQGEWAQLDDPRDLARFILGTKAETLKRLQNMLSKSKIENQVVFTVADWQVSERRVLQKIKRELPVDSLVIRSSALNEDGFLTANAGVFSSILNVNAKNTGQICRAINKVIRSYSANCKADQVLVQPMIKDVMLSGVVFTRTLAHGSPYYVVNYDEGDSTASITAGSCKNHKTLILQRKARLGSCKNLNASLKKVVIAVKEIESLVEYDALDIEFAVTSELEVCIFQVRPIAVKDWETIDKEVETLIGLARQRFVELQKPAPFVKGSRAIFGIMPDWNPAEIIGTCPGLLAQSLYSYLILDDIWARQRREYGYRNLVPQPLMVTFAGHPYVDVRASFNSFIPAALNDDLARRLVEFYTDRLCTNPHLHDKIEFEILPTCYSFDREKWEKLLMHEGGFLYSEVEQLFRALKKITEAAFVRIDKDLQSLNVLDSRFARIKSADLPCLDAVWLLLEDCREYGTLAFSHLARGAFVAISFLRSAVSQQIISEDDMNDFLGSLNTVSSQIISDAGAVASENLEMQEFCDKYGHLRPGTYDITSESYAGNPDKYLIPLVNEFVNKKGPPKNKLAGKKWAKAVKALAKAAKKHGLPDDADVINRFLTGAIEGREYAKFLFTRNLSLALEKLAEFGAASGLSRQQLANLSLADFLSVRQQSALSLKDYFLGRATENAKMRQLFQAVELPPLLISEADFCSFSFPHTCANFIGNKKVKAGVLSLSAFNVAKEPGSCLCGKIILIPQADPGYDWLFGQQIAGLITMYGGANSHIAIRAAEFGLPAAIGVGEVQFERLQKTKEIELDAANRKITIIR